MFNYTETGIISANPFVKKARRGDTRLLICPVELSAGGSVDAVYYPNAGEDTWPCKDDTVALIRVGGFTACFGAKPPGDPAHHPGEREFFGRNAAGEHKSSILLNQYGDIITKNDRDILTEAKGKEDVRITGASYHQSADTDLRSAAPIGLNDGLYCTGLQPYWNVENQGITEKLEKLAKALPQYIILEAISGGMTFFMDYYISRLKDYQDMIEAIKTAHEKTSKVAK